MFVCLLIVGLKYTIISVCLNRFYQVKKKFKKIGGGFWSLFLIIYLNNKTLKLLANLYFIFVC